MSCSMFRETVTWTLRSVRQSGKSLNIPLLRVTHTTLLRGPSVFCYKHRQDLAAKFWIWPIGIPRLRPSHCASRIVRLWTVALIVPRCRLPVGGRTRSEAATSGSLSAPTVLFFLVFNSPVLKPNLNLKENETSFIYNLFNRHTTSADSKRQMAGQLVNNGLVRTWKEAVVVLSEVAHRHFPRTEENHETLQNNLPKGRPVNKVTSVLSVTCDTHLFFWQSEAGRNLNSAQARQVHVSGELSLQFQKLRAGEGRTDTFARAATACLLALYHGARTAACGGATAHRRARGHLSLCERWMRVYEHCTSGHTLSTSLARIHSDCKVNPRYNERHNLNML